MAVKQTPTPKKFDVQDLEKLKSLQSRIDQIIVQLGQVTLQKHQLEESEQNLKQEVSKLKLEEQQLANELTTKYGKGTLDIESGDFSPQE